MEKNFGDLLVEGKFSCKNVKGKDFDEFYDYPLSVEGLKQFKKDQIKINKELKICNKKDQRNKAKNYHEYIDSFIGPTLRKMFLKNILRKFGALVQKK